MKLDIRTIPVSIQVITIDNKRMTKSIFNQIQKENCFDRNYYFLGNDILGYVFDKDQKWLLWVKHSELRKYSLKNIEQLSKVECKKDNNEFYVETEYSRDRLKLLGVYFHDKIGNKHYFSEDQDPVTKIKNAKSFLNQIENKQLFISI